MKRLSKTFSSLIALSLFTLTMPALAQITSGNVNLMIGEKTLDSDWEFGEDTEKQGTFAIDADFSNEAWPVSINAAFYVSEEKIVARNAFVQEEYEVVTTELRIGVKKIWQTTAISGVQPYVAGGLANISGEFDPGDSDSGLGHYISGGAFWTLTNGLNVGIDFAMSSGDVEIQGGEVDAGGAHTNILVGYHW